MPAAVGSAYTPTVFITPSLIGLCMGSGTGDRPRLQEVVRLSFLWIAALLYALTRDYVQAVFSGIPFVYLYNLFAYLLRAMGNPVVPLPSVLASLSAKEKTACCRFSATTGCFTLKVLLQSFGLGLKAMRLASLGR